MTSSRKVPIENLEFPTILDVCHTPAFNESILEEFGYSGIYDFFAGYSKYDKNIVGWTGHFNESVHHVHEDGDKIFDKAKLFKEPKDLIEQISVRHGNDSRLIIDFKNSKFHSIFPEMCFSVDVGKSLDFQPFKGRLLLNFHHSKLINFLHF